MIHPMIKKWLGKLGIYRLLRKTYRFARGTPIQRFLLPYRTRRFYRQFVPPGSLCFDVGANMGIRTKALRELGATVVAIEPQDTCCEILRQRFGKDPNVIIERVALGSQPGIQELSVVPDQSPLATLGNEWRLHGPFANRFSQKTKTVSVTTLDALIARHGIPAFTKIDVEGYEFEVLSGLHHPLPCVSFEYYNQFISKAEQCLSLLNALGFSRYNYSSGNSMRWHSRRWMLSNELITYLQNLKSSGHNVHEWGDIYAMTP